MRIISGLYGGRKIIVPKNLPIRPTTDMAKEGVFNILNNIYEFKNKDVADMFSGSGSIGLEFKSRMAKSVTFIENDKKCISHLKNISKVLNINMIIIKKDIFKFLNTSKLKFDLIFADPPYKLSDDKYLFLIDTVQEKFLKNKESMLILEHFKKKKFENIPGFQRTKNYGDCSFSFFQRKSG